MSNLIHTRLEENYRASSAAQGALAGFNASSWADFQTYGIPPVKHEEWKYARVSSLFRDDLQLPPAAPQVTTADIDALRLPGHENATELVFINGQYISSLSNIRHQDSELMIASLRDAAAGADAAFVAANLGHSASYHKDGIQALNGAFAGEGLFIRARRGKQIEQPVYIYLIADSRSGFMFSQPRSLVHVEAGAMVQIAEHYITLGSQESFTNEVFELVAEEDALVDYYKIQHEGAGANHVGTTHIRQVGKCVTNAVTISLSGALVRNNLNMIMESEHGESHMYGLSLLNGKSLVDNHTIVDNVKPHCFSNELYKAIMDEESTGVFNGKIFVRKDAQKTNAYQSNKNILVGERSSANTKPQLEIFADDVKCSHGCTIGRLDEESLFYLRARGLSEQNARSLLLHAFAVDILDKIKWEPLRQYVDGLISERLQFEV